MWRKCGELIRSSLHRPKMLSSIYQDHNQACSSVFIGESSCLSLPEKLTMFDRKKNKMVQSGKY